MVQNNITQSAGAFAVPEAGFCTSHKNSSFNLHDFQGKMLDHCAADMPESIAQLH